MAKRIAVSFIALVCCILVASGVTALRGAGPGDGPSATTFTKDVAPILQRHCLACHREGGMAPMSLESYAQARPWAKSVRENVLRRRMPPWHADPRYGEFANDRRLSKPEIDAIVSWVDGGVQKGEDKDTPPAPVYAGRWRIGQPDVVLSMPDEFTLGPEGPDEYRYFTVPTNFGEDRWVQAVETLPGNTKIVHHIIAFIAPPQKRSESQQRREGTGPRPDDLIFFQDGTLTRVKADAPVYDNGCALQSGGSGILSDGTGRDRGPAVLGGQAPGRDADVWPEGMAKRIPAGYNIIFQMHYSRNGSIEKDRSSVGLIFAKKPPEKEVFTLPIANHYFRIPPGADNHEVASCFTFDDDVRLISLMPHMHLRGKDMTVRARYPDGRSETLLSVPRYEFSWQETYYYRQPMALPKGTRIEAVAHFDNSAKNPANPDPGKAVRWGDPTSDDMMIAWVDYVSEHSKQWSPASAAGANAPPK